MPLSTIIEASPDKPAKARRLSLGVNIPVNERPNRDPDRDRRMSRHERRKSKSILEKYNMDCSLPVLRAINKVFEKEPGWSHNQKPHKSNRRASMDRRSSIDNRGSTRPTNSMKNPVKPPANSRRASIANRRASISTRRMSLDIRQADTDGASTLRKRNTPASNDPNLPGYAQPTLSSLKRVKR